jgi:septal ring factor EnvC (AmiA/AmiB activator)
MKKYNVSGKIILALGFLCLAVVCPGQDNRKDLEAQRKALESQIRSTSDILQKTQKDKTRTLSQLKAINAQIQQRQSLLESINQELKQVNRESIQQEKSKVEAEKAIVQLESRLGTALRTAYIRSQLQPDWIYVLSSQSIGQALTRWVYLRQYKSYIQRQVNLLADKKTKHQALIRQLEENKKVKTILFSTEEKNKKEFVAEQKSQESLARDLSK